MTRSVVSRMLTTATALAVLSTLGLTLGSPSSAPDLKTGQTLYARVGGYDFIARFVDTAFPRVAIQPQLRRLFQGHSIDSQLKQRQLIVDALCKEMGGPCLYIGRPMRPLHEGLHITESDWMEFMKIISATLVELNVAERERKDWIALFDRTFRPTIVEGPRPGG